MRPTIPLLLCAGGLCAQAASRPTSRPAPHVDPAARKAIAAWSELSYDAGRAGLRSVACDIRVVSKGGMTGTFEALAKYRFGSDPKRPDGVLTWDDDEVEHAMTRRGFTASFFAQFFRADPFRARLEGAAVRADTAPNGTIVTARREGREDTMFLFDRKGVLVGTVAGAMKRRLYYREVKGRFLWTGEDGTMPGTRSELEIDHATKAGFHLPQRITEKVLVRGKLLSDITLTFEKVVVEGRAATSRPATRPRAK